MGFFRNLFGRGGRVVRGQANRVVDGVENATFENTVKQAVRDMKTELNRTVRASAEAMSNYNRLEAEYDRAKRSSQEWHDRARKALEAGNEDLARRALVRRQEAEGQVKNMQPSVDQARETSERLRQQVADLRARIEEAERNASTLIARKNAARAQKKVAEALAGVGEADNAFAAIREFEERVAREEAAAKAFEEIGQATRADDLEKEFAALDSASVEDDLAKLKAEMAGA